MYLVCNCNSSTSKYVHLGVSPNFEITVACDLKFHCYLGTLSLKFQKSRTKIEVFLDLLTLQTLNMYGPKASYIYVKVSVRCKSALCIRERNAPNKYYTTYNTKHTGKNISEETFYFSRPSQSYIYQVLQTLTLYCGTHIELCVQ